MKEGERMVIWLRLVGGLLTAAGVVACLPTLVALAGAVGDFDSAFGRAMLNDFLLWGGVAGPALGLGALVLGMARVVAHFGTQTQPQVERPRPQTVYDTPFRGPDGRVRTVFDTPRQPGDER